jgi:hypothetical protein
MSHVQLYEEWLSFNYNSLSDASYDVFKNLKLIHSNINEGWIQMGKPLLNALKESCMPLLSMQDFKNEVLPGLNESRDYDSISKLYAIYEVSLLQTHRPDWFLDDKKVIVMPDYASNKIVLCKNGSLFIVSNTTWNIITESWWSDIKDTISDVASDVYDTVKDAVGKAWEFLSDGAVAVMEFLSKVYGIVRDLLNEDAIIVAGGLISIVTGIVKFCGAANTTLGGKIISMMTGSVGMIKSYGNIKEGVEGVKKLKKDQLSTKGMQIAPTIVDGSVSLLMAANDIFRAQTGKIESGEGGVSEQTTSAAMESAKKIGESIKSSIQSSGAITRSVEEIVEESSDTLQIPGVSNFGVALLVILFVKAGMDILGGVFNAICKGIGYVVEGIAWLLNMTENIKFFIEELAEKAGGEDAKTVTKIVARAVNFVATPIYAGMDLVVTKMKPVSKPIQDYLAPIGSTYEVAIPIVNKNLNTIKGDAIEIKNVVIKPKQDIKLDSKEKEIMNGAVKELQGEIKGGKSDDGGIKSVFKETDSGFKGIKDDVKKVKVVIDDLSVDSLGKMIKSSDMKGKVKFEYDGKDATNVQDGGKIIKMKAVGESSILSFTDFIR